MSYSIIVVPISPERAPANLKAYRLRKVPCINSKLHAIHYHVREACEKWTGNYVDIDLNACCALTQWLKAIRSNQGTSDYWKVMANGAGVRLKRCLDVSWIVDGIKHLFRCFFDGDVFFPRFAT